MQHFIFFIFLFFLSPQEVSQFFFGRLPAQSTMIGDARGGRCASLQVWCEPASSRSSLQEVPPPSERRVFALNLRVSSAAPPQLPAARCSAASGCFLGGNRSWGRRSIAQLAPRLLPPGGQARSPRRQRGVVLHIMGDQWHFCPRRWGGFRNNYWAEESGRERPALAVCSAPVVLLPS